MAESNEGDASKVSPDILSKKRRIPGACDICRRKKGTSIISRDHSKTFLLCIIADLNFR